MSGAGGRLRIDQRFEGLREAGRAGLVTFLTAGDPSHEACLELLLALPQAGADVIELGMPFSDPMADGPTIQAASERALAAGASMKRTLELLERFRRNDQETPVILMGYFNPIHAYGVEAFVADAGAAGADGLIVVDLPPEEDAQLRTAAVSDGMALIRLATPTTDDSRLPVVLKDASGFIYYVSTTGVTGAGSGEQVAVASAVARIKSHTDLPVAVGFGIKTPDGARAVAAAADAVVVGSAIVERIGRGDAEALPATIEFIKTLATAVRAGKG